MTFFELKRDYPEKYREFEAFLEAERLEIDGKVFDLFTNRPVLLCDACFPGGEELTIGLTDTADCWVCGAVINPDINKYHFKRARELPGSFFRRIPYVRRSRRVFVPRFNSDNRADWVGNTW